MSELTVGQLIKLIIGIFVIVAVVAGAYFFFKGDLSNFFNSLPGSESVKILLGLIK